MRTESKKTGIRKFLEYHIIRDCNTVQYNLCCKMLFLFLN
jgi:hypothetical protein